MNKKTVDLMIVALLASCLGYASLTGLVMHALHVPMIVFHDLAGYIATILSIVHMVRKRDHLRIYFRQKNCKVENDLE